MTKVLIKSSMDYADEFDVHGFYVCDKEEFDFYTLCAKEYFENGGEEIECYFGTNEAVCIDSYDTWSWGLEIVDISDSDAEVLLRLFGKSGFGRDFIVEPAEKMDRYFDEWKQAQK